MDFGMIRSSIRRGIALVVLVVGSPLALAGQSAGTITGVVLSAGDRAGVAEASVHLDGGQGRVYTDAAGKFRLVAILQGTHVVVVQRVGFRPARQTVTVAAGGTVDLEIMLTEAPSIIEPLTVTASRVQEEARQDLPVSIGVLTGEEIARMRPTHVAQPLNRVAGVRIVEFEGGGTHNAIRQPLCCKPTLLIMEDGIPFTSPAYYTTSQIGNVNFAQSGQIEILKGPGTAAYGSDAVSGVVNFVSAPAPATPGGQFTAEAGGAGYKRLLSSGGGTFGAHTLAAHFSAVDADGRRNNPYQGLSTSLRWTAATEGGAAFKTYVSFNRRDGTGTDDQTPEQYRTRSAFNPYPIAFDERTTLRASTSYQQQRGRTSWIVTPFFRYDDSDVVPGWQLSYNPVVWEVESTSLGLISQLRHELGGAGRARIMAGVDLDYTPGSRREPVITPVEENGVWTDWSLDAVPPRYDYDTRYLGGAAYAQIDFRPVARLDVSLGGRFDAASYDYTNHLSVETTGSFRRPADTSLSYRKLTPKVGLSYALTDQTRLFGSYRRGFRVPIEQNLFKQGSSTNTLALQPIEAENWELGVRSTINDRVTFEVTGYTMTLHKNILSYRGPTGITALTNNGETTHRGVELSLGAALTRTLSVDGAFTHAVHRFATWAPSSTLDFSGNEMDAAPHSLRSATVTWMPRFLGGGQVQVEYLGMGDYWLDGANTVRQDGYDVFHLRASYVMARRIELYGRLMNVTDALYAAQAFEGFGDIDRLLNPGEYRTFYAGVRVRF